MPLFGSRTQGRANVQSDDKKSTHVAPRRRKRKTDNWYTRTTKKISDFDALALFEKKRPPPVPRTIYAGLPLPPTVWAPTSTGKKQLRDGAAPETIERKTGKTPDKSWVYPSNQVLTSKYNIVTFLPKNLLEQFRRIANIFFLVLVILQFFPRFTNVSPALAALPLLVVLGVTALKDGYEDFKRHQSDKFINNLGCHVLAGPGVLNVNMTEKKTRALSFRWLTRMFGNKRNAKQAEKASEALATDIESNRNRTIPSENEDNEIISPKIQRNWWGTRKTKIKARAPDGDNEKIGTGSNRRRRGLSLKASQPAMKAPALQSYLFDEGDDADQRQALNGLHSRQVSSTQVPTQSTLSSNQTANGHGQSAAKHASVIVESEDSRRAAKIAHWKRERWEDVKVGDFIRLTDGDSIPADVIVCATSEEENVCYVETKNLDGETNLKVRQAISELTHIRSAKAAADAKFFINSEAPDVNMFKYNASVEIGDGRMADNGKALRASANLNTTLLRGCVLRNTEWVIGIVVFTGIDTKIVMNSGGTPSKRSRVERQMNPMVFLNLFLLALMCIMCAIGDWALELYYFDRNAYWEYGADRSDDNPRINGLVAFANAMITFQNIVPISLYISIEFVRTVQAFYIWADDDIKYEPTSRRTLARSWNLSDDLGQIEYVFSDKTGTLTQNSMQFRHCSIGGTVFKGDGEVPANTVVPNSAGKEQAKRQDEAENKEKAYRNGGGSASSNDASSGEETRIHPVIEEGKKQTKLPAEVLAPFHDAAIDRALAGNTTEAERITMFFTNLGLCHTVLASEDGEGHIEYKAQSPDEAALVQAAADVGFVFRGRDSNILHLQTPTSGDRLDKYELLNTLEFTSARKRMSVLLRKVNPPGERQQQNPVILFAKGADNIIFERLAAGNNDALKKTTDGHLEEFASEGLRTLTLAWKHVPEDQYQEWAQQYHEATLRIDDREDEIERVAGLIENELTLLGATAIEDKLQDGVPEAIADLKRAGMKVWVATGDKLETAIAIGMSSNLLAKDMNLIVIRGGAYGEPRSAYSQMRSALINFFQAEDEINDFDCQPPDYDHATGRPSLRDRRHSRRRSSQAYGLARTQSGVSGLEEFVGADNGRKPGGYGLVIDGGSLTHALAEDYSKEMLLFLATRCQAVICCRVSPLQKALIVRLVKDGLGVMCLAIGDGANDVSMIQAADVGVGVAGEEGLQAVNSSDYAIGQFRFLCKLLFVHGHWSYMRNSEMICNFFYKEIIGIGILFFFQFYCAFSTTTVYEYTYILFWNVFWTLVPVLAMGIFDRNLASDVIMAVPEVYRFGIRNAWFGLLRFSIYMLDGVYASAVIYFFLAYTYNTTTARPDGYGVYIYEFSTVMAVIAVITANIYNGFNTFSWNWWVLGGVLLGPVLILCYTAIYAAIKPGWIWTNVYGNNTFLWPSAYWWLGMFFCFFLCMLPKYFMRYWNENYRANDIDILKFIHKRDPHHDFLHDPMIPAMQQKKKYADKPISHPQADVDDHDRPPMLGQRGRQMTDASGAMVPMSGRGFAFDEDPHPRPSTSSRPGSVSNVEGISSRRRRARSIRLGPVTLDLPSLHSPGTLRRTPRKGRAGTIGTLSEHGESPTTPRTSGLRTATSYERPTTPTPAPASSLSRGSHAPEDLQETSAIHRQTSAAPADVVAEPAQLHLYVRED